MKRGDLFLASAGSGYAGKPRPVLIIQADALGALSSVVVIPLTTFGHEASIVRPAMGASPDNGLDQDSFVMLDKVVAIPRTTIGPRLGSVDVKTLRAVNRGLATVLGLGQKV